MIKIFGTHDEGTLSQIKTCLETQGERAVLCADGHKGYAMPIGGVVAYRDKISVSGVGFDIACGNMAVRTDARISDVEPRLDSILDEITKRVSFGMGVPNNKVVDHELFDDELFKTEPFRGLKALARSQLGTVGGGNHYVDLFVDSFDSVWIGVHFGSRGFGHKLATHFLALAGGKDGMDVPPAVVDANTNLGVDYLNAMHLAGRYAYAGREWVVQTVLDILGANAKDTVHNHHNFAWKEKHFGDDLWVVRKGATPAFPGQRGFIGGSMGDNAVIIEGNPHNPLSEEALYSTVHGAGRIMSRTAAKGRSKYHKDTKTTTMISKGLISQEEWDEWMIKANVKLRGADLDESPQAYRRLTEVLAAHEGTIRVLYTLRPIGVVMAPKFLVDPYRD